MTLTNFPLRTLLRLPEVIARVVARLVAQTVARIVTRVPKPFVSIIVPALMMLLARPGLALDDQWYVGFGGGITFFDTQPLDNSINVDEEADSPATGSVFIGRDLGDFSSIQLQLNSFGAAELDNGTSIDYQSVEGAVLYRFYDSRDRRLSRDGMALALYGRVGLGRMNRDVGEDLALKTDGDYYFGAGLGAEWFVYGPVSLRAEVNYVDQDVQTAFLGLGFRFGGAISQTGGLPPAGGPTSTASTPASLPAPSSQPETSAPVVTEDITSTDQSTVVAGDLDGDGVADSEDQCANSTPGYPVRTNGCPLLNGVLSGIQFEGRTATLTQASFAQLDNLANLLLQYPETRVQLVTHTDASGDRVEQAKITRARLQAVGSYLLRKGISARRLVLRSLGGERPIQSNDTASGRAANNRVEVFEQP